MVDWFKLTPREVEWVVQSLYDQRGFKSIITAATKDGGVDVFADYYDQAANHWLKYLIQVKRHRTPIGVEGPRELLGLKQDHKSDRAVLVSISGFTKPALDFASRHDIQMINREKFEELLAESGLLKINGSLTSSSDLNLPQNRRKIIYQILEESRPLGLSANDIIKRMYTPRFGITVRKEVLEQDLRELSVHGEIVEESGEYFIRVPIEEVKSIVQSLSKDIPRIPNVFKVEDIFKLLSEKYKVPLPVAQRLIPVGSIVSKHVSIGKITCITDGVFIASESFTKIKRFEWSRDDLKKNILKVFKISVKDLNKTMEDIRTQKRLPEGPYTDYFYKKPLEKMPFMFVGLHFCKDRPYGALYGALLLPLFMSPASLLKREKIKVTRMPRKGHFRFADEINLKGLIALEEKSEQICRYGDALISLIRSFGLEKHFTLVSKGTTLIIHAEAPFRKKWKLNDVIELFLDKAELLAKFLISLFKKSPPPLVLKKVNIKQTVIHPRERAVKDVKIMYDRVPE